ncbi:hypothetical protein DW833_09510 [Anaerobutyricum hallii]|uniref:Uncharacterized protein n=1 Tax=Anaerobutyricum hallii TaxID=39488 RepID=A0A414B4Q4_9FIRM|nr:hypothetical protein [Anaerobutyricum hallii]RHC63615.1 hypothetical protein DW833_09510 [Anaerobutyricum hallii]
MEKYSIASLLISILAFGVSVINVIRSEIWNRKNRKNDIKPVLGLSFVDCYTEGTVPNIQLKLNNNTALFSHIYLKLNNFGMGVAVNIKIYYSDNNSQILVSTFPLIIRASEQRILMIDVNEISIDKLLKLDIIYEDIDTNEYFVGVEGIYMSYGNELRPRITSYNLRKKQKLNPQQRIMAKYIEGEL